MAASVTFAARCHYGGKTTNEDTFFAEPTKGGAYFGVFDGHGDYGRDVAEAMRDHFWLAGPAANLATTFTPCDGIAAETILKAAKDRGLLPRRHEDGSIITGYNYILRGGTTASLVKIIGDKIHLAHVGDSDVAVIREGEFTLLTKDHSCNSVPEYTRLYAEARITPKVEYVGTATGVYQYRPVFVTTGDSPASGAFALNPLGPFQFCTVKGDAAAYLRGTAPSGGPGERLNMLRAIGDFSLKKHGLSAVPDCVEYTVKPGRNYILAASDGLYDCFEYFTLRDMVLDLAKKHSDLEELADALLEATLEASRRFFGEAHDNTTFVLAVVDVALPSGAAASGEPTLLTAPPLPASEPAEYKEAESAV